MALLMVVAALVTIVFKLIKQPVVLGYIIAGFLVSPNVAFLPDIAEIATIKILAEIGVIFLLFGLGLEFSFKKLKSVGGPASVTGIFEIGFMSLLGFSTAKLLGWQLMDSIFLGGILSISSTTIIIRTFDELKLKTKQFASLVFGVLIVEDLVAILLLVLLSTIAVTQQFEGHELFLSSLKLGFFLLVWFAGGIFFVPSLIRRCKHLLNEELLLVLSIALCLLMVILATEAGFSSALGAFIMGSVLAGTSEVKRIESVIHPIKDFFGAIFFVSVGMLIDPKVIIANWQSALLITGVLIVGKVVSVSLGAILAGQTLKNSFRAGFSMAQIGEFSFIIATLGMTLKVTSEFLYPLAVVISVITAFTTPYLVKFSQGFAQKVESVLPPKLTGFINRYSSSTQAISVSNQAREALKGYIFKIILLSIVLLAITILSRTYFFPFFKKQTETKDLARAGAFFLTFILSAPFFWALMNSKLIASFVEATRSRRFLFLSFTLNLVRYLVAAIILGFQVSSFFPKVFSSFILLGITIFGLNWFSRHLQEIYDWFEQSFIKNLHGKEEAKVEVLLPWEAHLEKFEVSAQSPYLGLSLQELAIRDRTGVSVVMIERGGRKIKAPRRDEIFYPLDLVSVVGTDEQLKRFKDFIDTIVTTEFDEKDSSDFVLKGVLLGDTHAFVGKTIRDSGVRERTHGLIVGIERVGSRIVNPDVGLILEAGDLIWVVGDKEKLEEI
jgi:monovalent cation:H+ antiporter-2, CPA2 family